MSIHLQRYVWLLIAILLLPMIFAGPASAQDYQPSWDFQLPGNDRDGYDDGIMNLYTEPGHPLLYLWTFEGDLFAFNDSGSVVWKGFIEDSLAAPAINPAGDLWLVGPEKVRAYSLSGELLIDKDISVTPPQKQIKRAVVTTLSPDFNAVYGLNIDGDYVWAVNGLGDYQFTAKTNINPEMYFLVETFNDDDSQVFYGLDPWSAISWSFDTTDIGSMPVVGVTARLRHDGSIVFAEAFGADMLIEGYGEPGTLVSLSAQGDYEWTYPEDVCLVSDLSAGNGTIYVVTADYALRAISRNGNDLWDLNYDDTDNLMYCHGLADSGVIAHFWALVPGSGDYYADYVARLNGAGDVVFEGWIEDPAQYYGYSVLFDETLVIQDGEDRIVAFDF